MKDYQLLVDKLQTCFEKAEAFADGISATNETELAELFRERAFIRPNEVLDDVADFPLFFLTNTKQTVPVETTIDFGSKPQPSFNKNFKLLIEDLGCLLYTSPSPRD